MSPSWVTRPALATCFPRVSGDEPTGGGELFEVCEFSPRERG